MAFRFWMRAAPRLAQVARVAGVPLLACAAHTYHHQQPAGCFIELGLNGCTRRVEDDYVLGKELGSGSFAVVTKGTDKKTGKQVAIKRIPKELQSEEAVRKEIEIMSRVGMHRSIAKLENFYESKEAFYVVMEFVEGGELFTALCDNGPYSESDVHRPAALGARILSNARGSSADHTPSRCARWRRPRG